MMLHSNGVSQPSFECCDSKVSEKFDNARMVEVSQFHRLWCQTDQSRLVIVARAYRFPGLREVQLYMADKVGDCVVLGEANT